MRLFAYHEPSGHLPRLTRMVPTHKDFAASHLRAVFFLPEGYFYPPHLYRRLPETWIEEFDGDPTLLPIGNEAPREIPRLVLKDASGAHEATLSLQRIELKWNAPAGSLASPNVDEFYSKYVSLFFDLVDDLSLDVVRLAAVTHRYVRMPDAGRFLATHFCRDEWLEAPLNRPENFQLHAHKVYSPLEGWSINSWLRNKTSKLRDSEDEIVLVEQDLNTLAPSEASVNHYSREQIGSFFGFVPSELESILRLYYPEH